MADLSEKEIKPENKYLIFAAAAIGIIVAAYFFYSFIPSNYQFGILVGVALGFLYGFLKGDKSTKDKLLQGLIFALIVGIAGAAIVHYAPQIQSAASPYLSKLGSAGVTIKSLLNVINPVYQSEQFSKVWNSPETKASSESAISVQFDNAVNRAPLSVIANVKVKTQKNLNLKMQCFLDGNQITSSMESIALTKGPDEQAFAVICSNDASGKEISFKIETSDDIRANLPFSIGKGSKQGIIPSSAMDRKSYYSLLFEMLFNQPLVDGEYPMPVKIKREEPNSLINNINSIKLYSMNTKVSVECPELNGLIGDRSSIEKLRVNNETDGYLVVCKTVISGAEQDEESAVIIGEMNYDVVKEFKTSLRQV